MRISQPHRTSFRSLFGLSEKFSDLRIQKKLFVVLLPPIILLLAITGFLTHWISSQYLHESLSRTSHVLAMAQAHGIESLLTRGRDDVVLLARGQVTRERLLEFMRGRKEIMGNVYRELAYIGSRPEERILLVNTGKKIAGGLLLDATEIEGSPLRTSLRSEELKRGDVQISEPTDIFYPASVLDGEPTSAALHVIRLTTPVIGVNGTRQGELTLSMDVFALRDVLSLYNSPRSPLYAFPRTAGNRYSFFFDAKGWILFQSENVEDPNTPIATDTARSGLRGDHGKAGYAVAFRPSPEHELYWAMVSDVQVGKHGIIETRKEFEVARSSSTSYFLSYTPVSFRSTPDKPPVVIGGVAYLDISRLTMAAVFNHFDIMFGITIFSILLISTILIFISRAITRPILKLSGAVRNMLSEEALHEIDLPECDLETTSLKQSINQLIGSLSDRIQELRQKDAQIQIVQSREKISFEQEIGLAGQRFPGIVLSGIVGQSQAMQNLKSLILKAASVDVDILVLGETGTGKELTAEAIHQNSNRAECPYISINCGALDENLLMDALFGHVKGAFSEAKVDRKGAFLAAQGGTLLLDEIGNASPKVQQSLLRALSVRRIRPLGSDKEIDFDVRVIAATNVNMKESVKNGSFREDLFYRLAVITIETPPLRDHREDIPILARHFLNDAAKTLKREEVHLSRGAMEKLKSHDWPGNVRELKNCLIRALAMAEGDLIYLEDLRFDDKPESAMGGSQATYPATNIETSMPRNPRPVPPKAQDFSTELNARQQKAWQYILEKGTITRAEYQSLVGGSIPPRTAQYDLQLMVKRGLIRKSGQGPGTRYHLAQ